MAYSISDSALKVRENRLRQAARRRLGATLVKSRRRDPLAIGYGRYWLIVPRLGEVIGAGDGRGMAGDPPGLTLDEVEAWLEKEPVAVGDGAALQLHPTLC